MPLSEHEQRMLDQIESALYAEDPKFASNVRGGRMHAASSRRRLKATAVFVLGLVLLIAGVPLSHLSGGFPVISLLGFAVMFGAGVLALAGSSKPAASDRTESGGPSGSSTTGPGKGRPTVRGKNKSAGGFSARMEERFRKRFEQD